MYVRFLQLTFLFEAVEGGHQFTGKLVGSQFAPCAFVKRQFLNLVCAFHRDVSSQSCFLLLSINLICVLSRKGLQILIMLKLLGNFLDL